MSTYQILIVEDDTLAGEDLKFQLEHLGYQVTAIVPSAQKALKSVNEHQPDLVLMDIFLEGDIDGIQAAVQIHEHRDVPVVFMSIFSDKDVLERAKVTHPFGFIVKPYTERELQAVLSMALYRAESEKKIRNSHDPADTLGALGAALVHTDNKGRVCTMSGFAEVFLGAPINQILGKWLPDLVDLRDNCGGKPFAEHLENVLSGQLSWVRVRDLLLATDSEKQRSVDLTICAGPAGDSDRGADVLLQFNDGQPEDRPGSSGEGQRAKMATEASLANSGGGAAEIDAFIGAISHDLRAPLGALGRFVHVLDTSSLQGKDDALEKYVQGTHQAIRKMQQLIQNLVIYMRLGRGRLITSEVDLDQALTESLEEVLSQSQYLDGRIDVDRPLPKVRAHFSTLVHILTQVLANSFQFVTPGTLPKVHVRAEVVDTGVRLYVDDQAVQIPVSQRESNYGLFQRIHYPDTQPGAGIGLAMVRRGAAWMGGRTGWDVNNDGGNRFWLELPSA